MVSYFGENFFTLRHLTIQILTEWQTIRFAYKYHGTEIQNLWRSGPRFGTFLFCSICAAVNKAVMMVLLLLRLTESYLMCNRDQDGI